MRRDSHTLKPRLSLENSGIMTVYIGSQGIWVRERKQKQVHKVSYICAALTV